MLKGLVVAFESSFFALLKSLVVCALCNISIVIADHLKEEGLAVIVLGGFEALVYACDNSLAFLIQTILHLGFVLLEGLSEISILGVLLDRSNSPDGTSLRSNEVLKTNTKEISFVDGELLTILHADSVLEVLDHVFISLSLLGNSREENLFFHTVFLLNF